MRRWIFTAVALCGFPLVDSFQTPHMRPLPGSPRGTLLDVDVESTLPSVAFYSARFPSEMYQDFLQSLRTRFDVTILEDLASLGDATDCVVAHSIAGSDVLQSSDLRANTSIVLIDPTAYPSTTSPTPAWFNFDLAEFEETVSTFIEANKFKLAMDVLLGRPKQSRSTIANRVLVVNSKLSNRWKVVPPIPPPRKYALDLRGVSDKVVREFEGYGYFDIMDTVWANMGKRVTTGTPNDDVSQYHEQVAEAIAEFIVENNTTVM